METASEQEQAGGLSPADEVGIMSVLKATPGLLKAINYVDDHTVDRFDRVIEAIRASGGDLFSGANAAGDEVDPALLAFSLAGLLVNWYGVGAQQVIHLHGALELRKAKNESFGTDEGDFIESLIYAMEPLAQLQLQHSFERAVLLRDASSYFSKAAAYAERQGLKKEVLAAHDALCALIGDVADPLMLPCAHAVVRAAEAVGDSDTIALRDAGLSQVMVAAAEKSAVSWIDALDSAEKAFRNLPSESEAFGKCLGALVGAARKPELTALRFWLGLVIRPSEGAPAGVEAMVEGLYQYAPLIYRGEAQSFLARATDLVKLVSVAEDDRLRLLKSGEPSDMVEARWSTWSFDHPAYRNAIPHGDSFLRERDLDELVLMLKHEITHVSSMVGGIGMAVMGLRAALVETEMELWSNAEQRGEAVSAQAMVAQGIARLRGDDVMALAQAERALEISLKLCALQECWLPWFEGIAIFEELADPTQDTEAHVPSIQILMNMVDQKLDLPAQASEDDIKAQVEAYFKRFEELYKHAIENVGAPRLRTYLQKYGDKYLPGYLGARSLVAAWRNAMGRALSGAEAGRLLLYVTRLSTSQAVPDLAVPLAVFRAEVVERHIDWIKAMACLDREQLELLLGATARTEGMVASPSWRDGRFVNSTVDVEKIDAEVMELLTNAADRAYASLRGDFAEVERVPGADPNCRTLMRTLAEPRRKRALGTTLLAQYIRQLNVLPIGEVDAPFWLVPEANGLAAVVRTTEVHRKHGTPSYNMEFLTLEPQTYAALEAAVRKTRHARMRIARLADMMPAGFAEGRGFGRNVMAYAYGDWIHARPCGVLSGGNAIDGTLLDDILARVRINPLTETDAVAIAAGQTGARRTRDWLQSVQAWLLDGRAIDLEPWVARVRSLCDEVLDPQRRKEHEHASRALLRLVLGDELRAARVAKDGLIALRDDDASIGKLSRLLQASAHAPVASGELTEQVQSWPIFGQAPNGTWDVRLPAI